MNTFLVGFGSAISPRCGRCVCVAVLLLVSGCADATVEVDPPLLLSAFSGAATRQYAAPRDERHAVDVAERVLALGAVEGDDHFLFTRIVDIAASLGGDSIYVLDQARARVSAFSAGGRFLLTFGRHGRGPGEFQQAASVQVLPWNGRVAVWDPAAQRLTLFESDGTVAETRSRAWDALAGERVGKRFRAVADGFLLEVHSDPLTVAPDDQRGVILRLDTLGSPRRALFEFPVPPVRTIHREDGGGGSSTTWLNPPAFSPEPSWDVTPGGEVAFARGDTYDVYRFDGRGLPALRLSRAATPGEVTRDDRLRRIEEEKRLGLLGSTDLSLNALEELNRDRFATVRPILTGVLTDGEGGSWVRRFDTRADWRGYSRVWDRYASDGRELGVYRFTEGFQPLLFRHGLAYGVRRDDLGVEYVEAYRIPEM